MKQTINKPKNITLSDGALTIEGPFLVCSKQLIETEDGVKYFAKHGEGKIDITRDEFFNDTFIYTPRHEIIKTKAQIAEKRIDVSDVGVEKYSIVIRGQVQGYCRELQKVEMTYSVTRDIYEKVNFKTPVILKPIG